MSLTSLLLPFARNIVSWITSAFYHPIGIKFSGQVRTIVNIKCTKIMKFCFPKKGGKVAKFWNKLDQCEIKMNLNAKFGISSSYGLWDLGDTGTYRRTWLYRLGYWCWSRIYTFYGGCHTSFCLLHTFAQP